LFARFYLHDVGSKVNVRTESHASGKPAIDGCARSPWPVQGLA